MATLPGAWCYMVRAGTGRSVVSILWLGEMESLVCNFYLSLAARKIAWADPSLRYTCTHTGTLSNQQTTSLSTSKIACNMSTCLPSSYLYTYLSTSDSKIGTPVATLPGAWRYRVSAGTGWPGVSILWPGEVESLIRSFYPSVAAHKLVSADPSPRYTCMLLGP